MTVLSDKDLRRRIESFGDSDYRLGIAPLENRRIQPASVDLTLANEWRTYRNTANEDGLMIYETPEQRAIDLADVKIETDRCEGDAYLLPPHRLVLGSTLERVEVPNDLQGQVHGKSSLGRLGLLVHITAGFIDPGFKGKITLEMYNLNNRPMLLRAGMAICQVSFTHISSIPDRPYGHPDLGSKYQDQREVTGSRYAG